MSGSGKRQIEAMKKHTTLGCDSARIATGVTTGIAALGFVLAAASSQAIASQSQPFTITDLIEQDGGTGWQAPQSIPSPRARPRPQSNAPVAAAPGATTPARTPWMPRLVNAGRISQAERNRVATAIRHIERKEFARARSLTNEIRHPVARATATYVALRHKANNAPVGDYIRFVFEQPDWPTERIRANMEARLVAQPPDPASVIRTLTAFPPESGNGHLALALAYDAMGDRNRAAATIRAAWRAGELFGKNNEALARKRLGKHLTANDHAVRLRALLYNEDNVSGLRAGQYLGGAQLKLAKAWIAVNKRAGNARSLLNAVPRSLQRDPAYQFIEIQWHRRTGKELAAAKRMAEAPRDPNVLIDRDEWWIERRLSARNALEAGDPRLAYIIAAGHAAQTEWLRIEAEFHAGWIALRFIGDANTAIRHFDQAVRIARTPISRARAHYWLARAMTASGNPNATTHYRTAAAFPTTYYGQLAINALGGSAIAIPARLPANKRLAASGPIQAAALLASIDQREYVGTFFYDLRERLTDPGDLAYIAARASELDMAHLQVRIGKKGMQEGFSLERHAYPVGVVPAPNRSGLPEQALIYAIARQESEFNARARSPAGALGLMQVMPATGQGIARRNGFTYSRGKLASDAAYNTLFGATYLGERIGQFNGSYILAIASYNAGKGRVDEWIARFGDPRASNIDAIDWVEMIPFTETRNYVQRVMENLQVYRALLPGTPARIAIATDLARGGAN